MNPVEVIRGSSPIILGLPHTGTHVPPDIWDRLNDEGRKLRDTDWHVHTLYDGLLPGATTVRATFHRYVIDANRDPSGDSLYPGQNTTGLVPLTDFDNQPIWKDGAIVGHGTSGGWGVRLNAMIGLATVHQPEGVRRDWLETGGFTVQIAGQMYPTDVQLQPFYDPAGRRMRA